MILRADAMSTTTSPQKSKGVAAVWVVFFVVWLTASASFELASMGSGAILTLAIAWLATSRMSFWAGLDFRPARAVHFVVYLARFLRDMVASNIAVLKYVYAPVVKIAPAIVEVPVRITGPRERLALTTTVALTPGTLTIDLQETCMDVHVLDEELATGLDSSVDEFAQSLEKAVG